MFNRVEVKSKGKELFKKYYWTSVLAAIVMGLGSYSGGSSGSSARRSLENSGSDFSDALTSIFTNPAVIAGLVSIILFAIIAGVIINALLFNNLKVGATKYFLNIQNDDSKINALIFSFKEGRYVNIAIIMFLKGLYVFLWSLLFVIPGIIKAYEYRMIPYILADDPTISREEAFRKSKEMMMGNKMAVFMYDLSFFGWYWLAVCCTCGILAIFYVNPYYYASSAVLYTTLKGGNTDTVDATSYVEY